MDNELFLQACKRQPVERTPIWLMRQAGRYQPEYRELRKKHSMMELCTTPELAAEVTLAPLRRFDFDAAILFSDLTMPFTPMGAPFELKENQGPVVENPIRTMEDVKRLRLIEPEVDLPFALETIRILRNKLSVPLIGFTGAPFTLAAYLVEGSGVRDCPLTRGMMYSDPAAWHALMEILAENSLRYLTAQIRAGAQAVQLFDSWVGVLSPDSYRQYLLPYMQHIFKGLAPLGVPVIHFGTGTSALLEVMKEAGGDVIGIDWRISMDVAWDRLGSDVAVQGNLDPIALLSNPDTVRREATKILAKVAGRTGYIFNLGHGVLPSTPLENVELLVNLVHQGIPT